MSRSLYLSATAPGSGKVIVALGLLEYLLRKSTRIGFFRPVISDLPSGAPDADIDLILGHFGLAQSYEDSFAWNHREYASLLSEDKTDAVLDRIIARYKALEARCDFVLCDGTDFVGELSALEFDFNAEIARNLGCPVLMIGNGEHRDIEDAVHALRIATDAYHERACPLAGVLVNKVNPAQLPNWRDALEWEFGGTGSILATLPHEPMLASPRVAEIAAVLSAQVLFGTDRLGSLAGEFLIAAMQVQHALTHLHEGQLVITPSDRADVIIGMLQADQSAAYPRLAGLLLSGGQPPEPAIVKLIEGSPDPLPILLTDSDTYATATRVRQVKPRLAADDKEKIQRGIALFDQHVDLARLEPELAAIRAGGMTPKLFTYNLAQQARSDRRHIVLPEGEEPRILRAAATLLAGELVELTLLGRRAEIEALVRKLGIPLDLGQARIIDPADAKRREHYATVFHQARCHKGVSLDAALDLMLDVSYFGTLMVHCGDAGGMVSGAVHTTQHTIRPALQIIKTRPGISLVSSVFLMCLDDGVVVYGDCAVNPNPNSAELAEIAIASADTAGAFGIEPRVALLSYSSGASGQGEDVDRVREAVALARRKRPELALDGPMQYDAAVEPSVAAQKMPGSAVAGRASVFVFPDLNTGNNTYKAVQRETGAIAIGPILQGLNKPVNDLSRGCTVEDIVNTVIITAIQAQTAAQPSV